MLRLLGVSSVSLKYISTNDYNLAIESEKVQGWSCGLKTAQTSCVSGIPDGVQFHEGETIADALTCFCAEELCNVEHFCDDCTVGSGTVSLQCNEGASGIHGFPLDLQPHTCEDGVVNCAKIVGSKFSIP